MKGGGSLFRNQNSQMTSQNARHQKRQHLLVTCVVTKDFIERHTNRVLDLGDTEGGGVIQGYAQIQ